MSYNDTIYTKNAKRQRMCSKNPLTKTTYSLYSREIIIYFPQDKKNKRIQKSKKITNRDGILQKMQGIKKGGEKTKKYIISTSIIITFAIVLTSAVQATTITNTNNGAKSKNNITVTHKNKITVQQGNTANVANSVNVNSNTGNNTANKNTNGNVQITTGNTNTNITIDTNANSNTAEVTGCNCPQSSTHVIHAENGSGSTNTIQIKKKTKITLEQYNNATVQNTASSHATTGANSANSNTGGNVHITSVDADTSVNIQNSLNVNTAEVEN